MSDPFTFTDFNNQWNEFYQAEQYDKAFDLTMRHKYDFPDRKIDVFYLGICMAARVGKNDLALQMFEECLDDGLWMGEQLLRESPSLESLQGVPEFEKLATRSVEMAEADLSEASPPVIVKPEGDGPYPVLIGLHGNMSDAQESLATWGGLEKRGWLLALPSSSQRGWMKGRGMWDERDVAVPELKALYEEVCKQYDVDRDNVVFAGHSMGAQLATWMALSGEIKVRGFVTTGPYLPEEEIDGWGDMIEAADKNLRGVMLLGDKDGSIPHEPVYTFAERLKAQGIECEIEKVPDATHEIGALYRPYFPAALEYVMGK